MLKADSVSGKGKMPASQRGPTSGSSLVPFYFSVLAAWLLGMDQLQQLWANVSTFFVDGSISIYTKGIWGVYTWVVQSEYAELPQHHCPRQPTVITQSRPLSFPVPLPDLTAHLSLPETLGLTNLLPSLGCFSFLLLPECSAGASSTMRDTVPMLHHRDDFSCGSAAGNFPKLRKCPSTSSLLSFSIYF